MAANKSTYTFLVIDGYGDFEFEIEPVFLNTKTQLIELLSSSSRTTPRGNKKPFGPIEKFTMIDEKLIKIENHDNDEVCLEVDRLSPLLDKEDSRLKSNLIELKQKPTEFLVKALNELIRKMHSKEYMRHPSENIVTKIGRQDTMPSSNTVPDQDGGEPCSRSGSQRISVSMSNNGPMYIRKSKVRSEESVSLLDPESSSKRLRSNADDDIDDTESDADTAKQIDNNTVKDAPNKAETANLNEVDIISYAESIIENVKYKGVQSDLIQIPACLKIDHEKVAELKNLMLSTPDKTQTWCGCVIVVNEDNDPVGPYWVYVNPELFVALKELACEGRGGDRIPVAIHTVGEDDLVDQETFGFFLNTNSKDFSSKLHDKLMYQDILRFCCATIANESEGKVEEVKDFLKRTMKGFSKGSQNSATFLKFGSLPVEYLNKFEDFLHQYETGSLPGQNLSSRKMMNKDKHGIRRNACKIELPIGFIKLHIKVSQSTREEFISELLSRKIEFGEYCKKLKDASSVNDMKKEVEKYSKKPFEEVKNAAPELFTDKVLLQFEGAKSNASGNNLKHTRLVKHVNAALKEKDIEESPSEKFICSDKLNLHSLGRKFKDYNVVILNCQGQHCKDQEFCLTEQVKDNKDCAGIIVKDNSDTALREEISATFSAHPDIVVLYVYTKVEKPAAVDGVRKMISPMVVFGHKEYFKDKDVKNFHNYEIKQALQFVVSDLASTKEKVLYSFSEAKGIDVDVLGTLKRRGVSVSYLAQQEVLQKFEETIGKIVK